MSGLAGVRRPTSTPRARPRGWARAVVGATIVGAAVLASAAAWRPAVLTSPLAALGMSQPGSYPVVRAAVNEHLRRVAARSTYQFNFASVSDASPALVTTPVVFEYDGGPGAVFRLPPGRLVTIGQYGGWAYDYTVIPQLQAGSLTDAYSTAETVQAALANAVHWRRVSGPLPSLDSLRGAATTLYWRGAGLGRWQLGTADLYLNLKAGEEQGIYFVEARIFDGSHDVGYLRRTYAIRRARQHGNELDALPLTEVLDDPTPVPPLRPQPTSAP